MSPLDAVYAFEDLGRARDDPDQLRIVSRSATSRSARRSNGCRRSCARELPLCGAQAQPREQAACVAILDHGESIRFGKQGA